jgi:hypothetical protein
MDGPRYPFPELPSVADRGETTHHEFGKITETDNYGKASTANRPQQMCYHGVFIRFGKRQWQVAFGVRRSTFDVGRSDVGRYGRLAGDLSHFAAKRLYKTAQGFSLGNA